MIREYPRLVSGCNYIRCERLTIRPTPPKLAAMIRQIIRAVVPGFT